MHQMQDGFSKVYMQLEALDERLQDVQAIGDKVDMLEASVRLLENHAFLWPMVNTYGVDPDGQSSVSSSSLHSMSTPAITTVTPAGAPVSSMMIKQRSLPKRNHTISSIKYDSSAYKVSFNLGGDVEDAPSGGGEPSGLSARRNESTRRFSRACAPVSVSAVRGTPLAASA